ncbi:YfhO family protein [Flavobacteriaceae bacterium]|nr:YfhO family protein [Flavobacteriaceae bacterium]
MRISINKVQIRKSLIHLYTAIGFAVVSLIFYSPLLEGKKLYQSDINQYEGMSREITDNRDNFSDEIYWIDNAFGGMPTFQLGAKFAYDILAPIHMLFRFIPRPAHTLFLYLLTMYILLMVLKIPWRIAVLGSIAFAFSTYLLIILQVGHNTKALAVSYIPLVLAGLLLLKQHKLLPGFLVSLVAISLQIRANHYQMTYYMLILLGIYFIVYLVDSYRKKDVKDFITYMSLFFLAGILSLGLNAPNILSTYDYSKYSTRSQSELKLNPDGTEKEISTGLDYDYITQYSYGIFESLNLIAPRVQGGASSEDVGEDSDLYEFLIDNNVPKPQAQSFIKSVPTYWGSQPILEAPAYIGASIAFLFILSLFVVKGPFKWWLLISFILSLLLSWGKNFPLLTNLFIDYVPFYNKFRAVSSIQVILEFAVPLLAVVGLNKFLADSDQKNTRRSFAIFSVPLIILFLFSGSLSFVGLYDNYYSNGYGQEIFNQIIEERKNIFNKDILRALLMGGIIFLTLRFSKSIGRNFTFLIVFIIVFVDLYSVNSRYIDKDLFIDKSINTYQLSEIDNEILLDTLDYRVFNLSTGLSNASSSYYHNSLNGYHAAKLRRFQEYYDYLTFHDNEKLFNSLNVKYLIGKDDQDQDQLYVNPEALGNAWAVDSLLVLDNPDELLNKLKDTDISKIALGLKNSTPKDLPKIFDSKDLIEIEKVKNSSAHLTYNYNALSDQLIVFSEIYYPSGWEVFVDGDKSNFFDVNYLLRGMLIPKGKHKIEFYFSPKIVNTGINIRIITIIITFSLIAYMLYRENKWV